jgi:maltose/moltooligosaccharide transporter
MDARPKLSFFQIWNMSFGFLGVQMGFALQNANASRILQTFGAEVEHLSWFWLVAPLTGMLVQPVIGYLSDHTWGPLGRRKPYFLAGALMAAIGLVLMPNAAAFAAFLPALWVGAGMLMIMDASFNVAMEPFRALVADKLPSEQRTLGFSVQTALIGIGAVVGSLLPSLLARWMDSGSSGTSGSVPTYVIASFFVGAAVLVGAILVTVFTTREYPPEAMARYHGGSPDDAREGHRFSDIFRDFKQMPRAMKQLGVVQFCSWFALFSMWVFTTPALAQHVWGLSASEVHSQAYQDAGNHVGFLFGIYNAVATVFAFLLPALAFRLGRRQVHAFCLTMGGLGLMSFYLVQSPDQRWILNLSMVGVGIAWASILAMPYAILAGSIPSHKMGVYMGIFNFFITFPQIVNGVIGGLLVKHLYAGQAVFSLVAAGVLLIIGAFSVMRVDDGDESVPLV